MGDKSAEKDLQSRRIIRSLKLCVFLDFLGVALVVPLLSAYFRDLNISNESFGLMASLYSASQLVGGLVLGALSDRLFSRRSMLLLSFMGSSIGYGLIGVSTSLSLLIVSRVVVGLVKQTLTISTALVTEHTDESSRAGAIGNLSASAILSFTIGPILGSLAFQYHKALPPLLSSSIFVVNSLLAVVLLPAENLTDAPQKEEKKSEETWRAKLSAFGNDITSTCSSKQVLSVVAAKSMNGFLARSMDASQFIGYFEERWNVPSHVLGYVHSYSTFLMFIAQVYLVGKLATLFNENRLVLISIIVVACQYTIEAFCVSWTAYLVVALPLRLVSQTLLTTCLSSLFTKRVNSRDVGAALGAMGVLQSGIGIISPVYGGFLFQQLGIQFRAASAAIHYLVFACLWVGLEMYAGPCEDAGKEDVDVPLVSSIGDDKITKESIPAVNGKLKKEQ